jgi:5-aminolevulinate synthase
MDKLSSLARFKNACPFLGNTKPTTLRALCTSTSTRFPALSLLTERATNCPVMGPALYTRSREIAAGYASIAGNDDVQKIHKDKGVTPHPGATVEMCPHASKVIAAARMAEGLAASSVNEHGDPASIAEQAAAAGCPFHKKILSEKAGSENTKAAPNVPVTKDTAPPAEQQQHSVFNYERFYTDELDKKHKDNSYRYFNNVNRLAAKFPVAHTAKVTDEVEVWCANDYLGMGNNPVVLETMQSVVLCFRS